MTSSNKESIAKLTISPEVFFLHGFKNIDMFLHIRQPHKDLKHGVLFPNDISYIVPLSIRQTWYVVMVTEDLMSSFVEVHVISNAGGQSIQTSIYLGV